jgi:hypothetical protein
MTSPLPFEAWAHAPLPTGAAAVRDPLGGAGVRPGWRGSLYPGAAGAGGRRRRAAGGAYYRARRARVRDRLPRRRAVGFAADSGRFGGVRREPGATMRLVRVALCELCLTLSRLPPVPEGAVQDKAESPQR